MSEKMDYEQSAMEGPFSRKRKSDHISLTQTGERAVIKKAKVIIFFSDDSSVVEKYGSKKEDVDKIQQTFKTSYPKFEVELQNLGSDDLGSDIEAARGMYEGFDCLICIILTNPGMLNVVKRPMVRRNITDHFNGENCPSLVDKPKLFLIDVTEKNKHEMDDSVVEPASTPQQLASKVAPYDSDILVAYYHGVTGSKGSPFIESLCQDLRNHDSQRTFHQRMIDVGAALTDPGCIFRFYSSLRREVTFLSNVTFIKKPKVVIIKRFHDHHPNEGGLAGYNKDSDRLVGFFKDKMNVVVEQNTKGDMGKCIETEYQKMKDEDGFICIIMSHGDAGTVLDPRNHNLVPIKKLIASVTDSSNPQLKEIPKLFFIQVCQGGKQECVSVAQSAHADQWYPYFEDNNIFLGLAATDDYVSWIHEDMGSIYLQSLCDVFTEYSQTMSLIPMMSLVNQTGAAKAFRCDRNSRSVVQKVNSPATSGWPTWSKQMPVFESSLTKDVFFECTKASEKIEN